MSHTPGPWAFNADADGTKFCLTSAGESVLTGCGCCGSPFFMNETNWKEDARLIAAAPDLLAVARMVVDDYYNSDGDQQSVARAARAAIAKATGETE